MSGAARALRCGPPKLAHVAAMQRSPEFLAIARRFAGLIEFEPHECEAFPSDAAGAATKTQCSFARDAAVQAQWARPNLDRGLRAAAALRR